MTLFPTQPFLGFQLAAITARQFTASLLRLARDRARPVTVGYLNAATVNLAFDSAEYARLMAQMDVLYADGMAVVRAARRLGHPIPERVNAGDFTREFIEDLATAGLKLALIGGRSGPPGGSGEAARAAALFQSWAPSLQIVFIHHGFFTESESVEVRVALERADPDVVLLGMGSPRQERWALTWAATGRPRVWWCVGALFEYYAGARRRAPVWVRAAGLEWAFRLTLEPARLWRRYLIGNPLFLWRVFRARAPRHPR